MGIEELARFGSVLGIDMAGAFGFASSLERPPVRGRRGSVAPMPREGLPRLGIDALGQGRKRQMTDSKIKSAKKLFASGLPPRDVATNLGVSVPTLFYRWIPASTQV
jgi:hypothetical protein